MFVRRKANKSGSYSVQVVEKRYGRYVVVRSFGASKDEDALKRMEHSASEFIASYNGQGVLDFQNSGAVTSAAIFSSIASIVQDGPYRILNRVYDGIGFGALGDETLRQLVVSRVCQPMSKLATVDYRRRYCGHDVDINKLYRYMDKLDESMRDKVQQVSVEHTTRILGGRIGLVFYDVTTLYFESSKEDGLRAIGFSKDGKTAETQIVLGLLVSIDGYPLAYSIFNGSQYEGRTIIPVIDDFVRRFSLTDFIIVADSGLFTRKNIDLLKAAGYKFILGGRKKKECSQVLDWVMSLDKVEERLNETVVNTDERIIVSYSAKRAAKDAHNRDKGIQRLRKAYSSGKVTKQNINRRGYNKFLVIENDGGQYRSRQDCRRRPLGRPEELRDQYKPTSCRSYQAVSRTMGCGKGLPYIQRHTGDTLHLPLHRTSYRSSHLHMLHGLQSLQGVRAHPRHIEHKS